MPVDRDRRAEAAVTLRRFADGVITNDDFVDDWPGGSTVEDRALRAIGTMMWNYCADNRVHKLTGDDALQPEEQSLVERCILFLNSELE